MSPYHNAGAEWTLHAILKWLARRGHTCEVIYHRRHDTYTLDGVRVSGRNRDTNGAYRKADVIVTHLDLTRQVIRLAVAAKKPIVHLVHNDRQLAFHQVDPRGCQLAVFNSRWIERKVRWPGRSIVVYPPVFAEDYRTTPGKAVTLSNVSYSKGAQVFHELARRMTDVPFVGVLGSYGNQVREERPNITYVPNAPHMRDVYGWTRILLMPSDYESWGRVAIEAAASGIPTLAHPTPGLTESLGDAGIFIKRTKVDEYERTIRRLLDHPAHWDKASAAALERSRELNPEPQLRALEAELLAL